MKPQVKPVRRNLKHQAGASLIESLMFIVVGALVLAGVVGLGVKVFGTQKEGRTNDQVVEISTSLRNIYAGQSSYGTAAANLIPTLSAANGIPSDVVTAGGPPATTATNLYGGALTVAVGAATNTYVISHAGLDDDVCLKVASKAQPGWVSVSINGGAAITALPVPTATAVTQCNGGAAGNTIAWTGR